MDVYGVQEEEDVIHENISVNKDRSISKEEIDTITQVLKNHFFFGNLGEEDLIVVVEKMFYASVDAGEHIFKQNDRGSCFFFIAEGEAIVLINGVNKKTLGVNSTFGELALLYDSPRSATIKCDNQTWFWVIDRITFKKLYQDIAEKQFIENRKF